jgi:anti-sigma factor RsiW
MFDSWRNRGSAAEKRLEVLGAYLDNALTPTERRRLEQQLARDPSLRAELEQLRALKLQLRTMPRRRAPRSFALNPALYSRPKAQPMMQLYPVLRGATALTAFLLIFTLALGAFRGQFGGEAAPTTAEFAVSEAIEEALPAEEQAAEEEFAELAAPVEPTQRDALATAPAAGAAEAPAESPASEEITAELAIESAPVEGTPPVADAPATGLDLEAPTLTVAPTAEPTMAAIAEAIATEVVSNEPADSGTTTTVEEAAPSAEPSPLPWIQIGLAVAFVLLLLLWLIARRRIRSL